MPTKIDPPAPPFIAARWHGGAQTPRKRIVIHGTVSACKPGGARSVANYFAHENNKTSAHYVVDPSEVIQCVGDHKIAYHAPPNTDTIGVELCDMVSGPASRWADKNHTAMLERAAKLVARLGLAYDIPLKRLTVAQLKGGQRGICGHVDVSLAWHQTTHTDPGTGFPWDRFMGLVAKAAADLLGGDPPPPPPPPPDRKPVALDLAGKTLTKLPSLANAKLALDYSWGRPDLTKAKADRRVVGMVRYLSVDSGKNIGDAERARIHKIGDWIWFVHEDGKTPADRQQRALQGHAAGVADAKAADSLADSLGLPDHAVICHAVDTDAAFAQVRDYWEGIHSAARRERGVYGSDHIVTDVVEAGLAKYGWQTTSWSQANGKLHVSKHANLLQLHGAFRPKDAEVAGLNPDDYDPNLVLAGPKIPVWLPGQAKRKPPPPPPPPPPAGSSTVLTLVGQGEVLEKRSSDHRAVVWTVRLSSGKTVRMGQANLQGTDAIGTTRQYVDWLLPQADAWVFNEVTSFALQKYVYNVSTPRPDGTTLAWGRYMHGFGADAKKKVDSAAVALVWNTDVLQRVATSFEVLSHGVFSKEPTRVLPRVLLELVESGERFWRQGSHTEQHVDVGGKARIRGAITGQNRRAKHNIAAIADDIVQATSQQLATTTAKALRGGGAIVSSTHTTYPLFGSADLNVDYDADRAHSLKGDGTKWFPYTVLGRVAHIRGVNNHGPTHGNRLIDWGWFRQAH